MMRAATGARGWIGRAAAGWQRPAKWLFAAFLAIDMFLLLFALAFANVTARGPAQRSLGHGIAILTEVDTLLDEHHEALALEARRTDEETMTLADFPIAVSFARDDVRTLDRQEFRALLLQRAAQVVHEDGMAAFRADRSSEVSSFSPQGALHAGLDFLRPTPHRVLVALTVGLAALAGALALGLLVSCRGYGRLLAVGMSVLLAALPFLVLAVAVRFAFRLAADAADDYLAREFLKLGQELTWAPIRNGIIVSAGSGILLPAAAVLARWSDARSRPLPGPPLDTRADVR
jgi:hypothetical protein